MTNAFREALANRVLLADGAMGTEIYRRGVFINRCYDELNLSRPDLVGAIHSDYASAGADIITTNTYGAERIRLAQHGLEDRLMEINQAAVKIAREAAGTSRFVAGSIGPLPLKVQPTGPISPASARETYTEQASILIDSGIDLLVLETFRQLSMLKEAVEAARSIDADIPILASFAFKPVRHYFVGPTPEDVAREVGTWGVDVLGTNCVNGPQVTLEIAERLGSTSQIPLSAMPNAGTPELVDGRTLYLASPEYMAEYARRFVQNGVQVVGGCCGTTPEMIREMRSFLQSVEPGRRRVQVQVQTEAQAKALEPIPTAERSRWGSRLGKEFAISVELDAPRGLDPKRPVEGSRLLAEAGIQAVNIADGPRATARMSALALAMRVREEVDIDVIVHYCCRDRNILGMQMDLLGAHALGIHNILCVTGDPPKMGNYPDATAVFDLDSVELVRGVAQLNRGIDFGGDPIGEQTRFVIGCGNNPGFEPLDKEVDKFRRKLEAGAEFAFSQPAYDPSLLENFLAQISRFPRIPFFVGILPLASARNADFLHNEVPGMQIPAEVRARMHSASTREEQRAEGLRIAAETLRHARSLDQVDGAYIFPPFGRYSAVLDVLNLSENLTTV
ncbi:MAG: bifunctional homocysteine S-methyltransferase/methylenetetrahydrofolate reductase [Deltaproteobacteria bacterium]|nr:bifunctional homocysteine S-methyltransferase/methylenetetrahydrofolate reductase [Deltaproteobacteria bacterium]